MKEDSDTPAQDAAEPEPGEMKRPLVSGLLRRLRPLAMNLGLVVASMGFAAILAEVAVRVAAPQQLILIRPDLWQAADTVGWLHQPNVNTRINTGERTVTVFTDADGFRVGPDGPVREGREVLLLGDSFMEALQVDYEQSAAGILETTLPAQVGGPVALRNAGIGGWDPDQYLLRARSLLARREYDLVVTVLYLGNDVISVRRDYVPPRTPVQRYRLRLPRRLSWVELTDAFLRPINDFFEVRSHLFVLFKNRMQNVRAEVGLAAIGFPPHFLTSEASSEAWEITAVLCEEIGSLASEQGAEALFVLMPTSFQVDSADLRRTVEGFDLDVAAIDLDQPNRRLGEELTDRGLRVYDALPAFRAAHDDGTTLYGTVDQHLSPEGNELFAGLVGPLAANLLGNGNEQPSENDPPTRR